MKNKILTTIIGIIFSMFLVIVFAIPTYAVGDIEANVILEKIVNVDNKIQVALETSQNQSIASFNISLLVETVNMQDIKSVKIDWNSDISNNAELKELTYSNNKINIYVVSKNELGNNNVNKRKIDIGIISIETENKNDMDVVISAHKDLTRIVSIGHEAGVITNDISTMVQLQIAPTVSDGSQEGNDNQGGNNQGGNTQGGNNNQGGNGNQNGNNNQDVNDSSQEDSNVNGEVNPENEDESKLDNNGTGSETKNETDNIAQGDLPKAGVMVSNIIIFSIIAIGVIILITVIIIKAKSRQSRHYNTYK